MNDFGKRLADCRKAKGLTQKELGAKVGVSNRVISYYERESEYPPSHLIVSLAEVLGTTPDELLDVKAPREDKRTLDNKIARRMKEIEKLSKPQKKLILKTIDVLLNASEK